MQQYQVIQAIFSPRRTDDLLERCKPMIGKKGEFMAAWIIESGPYIGEWAMTTHMEESWPFAWCPEGDLKIIRILED